MTRLSRSVLVVGLALPIVLSAVACGSSDGRRRVQDSDGGAGGESPAAAGGPGSGMDAAGTPGSKPAEGGAAGMPSATEQAGQGGADAPENEGGAGGEEPAVELFEVAVDAMTGGGVAVTGAGCSGSPCSVSGNELVTLRATADIGFRFVSWHGGSGCDGALANPLQLTITQSVSCTAQFVARVVVSGAVSGLPAGTTVTATAPNVAFAACADASCEVDSGSTVTLSAPLVAGYYVSGWSGDGCPTDGSQISVPAAQTLTCTANYAPGLAVVGTVAGRSGSVSASSQAAGALCAGNQCAVPPGSSVALTRPADDPRGRWLGWFGSEDCTGTADTLVLENVVAASGCEARFSPRLLASAESNVDGEAMGVDSDDPNDVCGAGNCYLEAGSNVTFSAPAVAGYVFESWSGDCDDDNATTSLFANDADVSCYANYQAQLLVTGLPSDDAATITASAESDNCTGPSCIVFPGESVTFRVSGYWEITGTTGAGCSLDSDEGGAIVLLESAEYDGQTCDITVVPSTDFTLTASGDGSVTFSDEGGLDCFGEGGLVRCLGPVTAPVTLEAQPYAGSTFTGWSGATCPVNGSSNASETLTPPGGALECVATFAGPPTVTVTANAGEGAYIMFLEPPECEFTYYTCTAPLGSTFSIYIGADDGYLLNGWSPDDPRCQDMYDTGLVVNESFDCYMSTYYVGGQ